MSTWTLAAPTPVDLGDHDVVSEGTHLSGRRVALLVTGGIAAMKIPLVARALRRQGAEVVAFTSKQALRYVTAESLEWSTLHPIVQRLTAAAEHLSDSAPFDAYLVAPATYNSINKIAAGIADGVVTSAAASALGRLEQGRTAVLVAPTMHGSLHNRILVASLQRLHEFGARIISPRDAYGKHNLPEEPVLVAEVARALSRSPLRGRRILVTGGTLPVALDSVRCIVNRTGGRQGIAIASELHLRGAEVTLIQGDEVFPLPTWLPHRSARSYDEYRRLVQQEVAHGYHAGVFAAGVPDYQPKQVLDGRIPSGQAEFSLSLVPTGNVIEEVRAAHPRLHLIAFQDQPGSSPEQLLGVAKAGLDRFPCVIASRGEEAEAQLAWMVTRDAESRQLGSQQAIAEAVADHLENAVGS